MSRIRLAAVISFLLVFAVPAFAQGTPKGELPDSTKTPGVTLTLVPDEKAANCLTDLMGDKVEIDDAITQTMICTKGYSKCIRNVSSAVKKAVYKAYGMPDGPRTGLCDTEQGCEVDHLISIELGGANDRKNLWPQPYEGLKFNAHVKDKLENFLHDQVCNAGKLTLKAAQKEISTNWVESYKKHIGDPD
jgi:hypothetical protein